MATYITAADMYRTTLVFLEKEKMGTIYPDEWDDYVNAAQLEWVMNKMAEEEASQKRTDDLRVLEVKNMIIANSGTAAVGGDLIALPYDGTNVYNTVNGIDLKGSYGYLKLLDVAFRLQYVGDSCYGNTTMASGSYKSAQSLQSQRKNVNNPFYKPSATHDRLYYEFINLNTIKPQLGSTAYALSARVDFLRYPKEISVSASPNVPCELPIHARKEIVDLTVRKIIEVTMNPRYQTALNEAKNQII